MIYVLLDILIYNFTLNKSFFFLTNINNSLIYNISIGLFIDYFIIHLYFPTTIYLIIGYIIKNKLSYNYYNLVYYYLFNIIYIFIYYLLGSIFYNFNYNNILNIFIINSIFILIKYKYDKLSINFIR